jgi:hypothetical protein
MESEARISDACGSTGYAEVPNCQRTIIHGELRMSFVNARHILADEFA